MENAEIGIIAFGSTTTAVLEARDDLAGRGISTDYLRLRALPITKEATDFVREHDRVYIIEMNRDGQAYQIISNDITDGAASIISLTHNDGLALTAEWIVDAIQAEERK